MVNSIFLAGVSIPTLGDPYIMLLHPPPSPKTPSKVMKIAYINMIFCILIFYVSCEGQNKPDLVKSNTRSKTKIATYAYNALTNNELNVHEGVAIQNSMPMGGPYTSPTGGKFFHAVFWTRVVNKTATPLEIKINFPADSFTVSSSPDSYLKAFLPPGEMTLDKVKLSSYGAVNLKSFIDAGLNKPTRLQKTIPPNGECLFSVGTLSRPPDNPTKQGALRTGLVLKGRNLFYKIYRINKANPMPIDSMIIPCGHILFK